MVNCVFYLLTFSFVISDLSYTLLYIKQVYVESEAI